MRSSRRSHRSLIVVSPTRDTTNTPTHFTLMGRREGREGRGKRGGEGKEGEELEEVREGERRGEERREEGEGRGVVRIRF